MVIESVEREKKAIVGETNEKVRAALDKGAQDIFEVRGGDPAKVYRWVNTQKQNLETKKLRGWDITSSDKVRTLAKRETSQHTMGDLVLCEMDRTKYDAKKTAQRDLSNQRRRDVSKKFIEEAKAMGLKPQEEDNR